MVEKKKLFFGVKRFDGIIKKCYVVFDVGVFVGIDLMWWLGYK